MATGTSCGPVASAIRTRFSTRFGPLGPSKRAQKTRVVSGRCDAACDAAGFLRDLVQAAGRDRDVEAAEVEAGSVAVFEVRDHLLARRILRNFARKPDERLPQPLEACRSRQACRAGTDDDRTHVTNYPDAAWLR